MKILLVIKLVGNHSIMYEKNTDIKMDEMSMLDILKITPTNVGVEIHTQIKKNFQYGGCIDLLDRRLKQKGWSEYGK